MEPHSLAAPRILDIASCRRPSPPRPPAGNMHDLSLIRKASPGHTYYIINRHLVKNMIHLVG